MTYTSVQLPLLYFLIFFLNNIQLLAQTEAAAKINPTDVIDSSILANYHSVEFFYKNFARVTKKNPNPSGHSSYYYGYLDTLGNEVIPCQYDAARRRGNDFLFVLQMYNKTAVFDSTHQRLTDWYDEIQFYPFSPTCIIVKSSIYTGILDSQLNVVAPLVYDRFYSYTNNFHHVRKNGKWGFIDNNGKEVVPIIYDKIDNNYNSNLLKVSINNKVGLIDKKGEIIIPILYDDVNYFYNLEQKQTWVEKNGKMGMVNRLGKEVIPCIYDNLYWSNSMPAIIAVKDNKYGVIDYHTHTTKISITYDNISPHVLLDGTTYLQVTKASKVGLYDLQYNEILPIIYDEIISEGTDVFRLKKDGKFSFYDMKQQQYISSGFHQLRSISIQDYIIQHDSRIGQVAVPQKTWHSASNFIAKIDQKCGLVSSRGKILVPIAYDSIYTLGGAYQHLYKDILIGVVNQHYSLIYTKDFSSSAFYDHLAPFSNDLFHAQKNNKWGLINKAGMEVIPIQYDTFAHPIGNNFLVKQAGKQALLNPTGDILIPFDYDTIKTISNNRFIVYKNNKSSIVDSNQNTLTTTQYDAIYPIYYHIMEVKQGNQYGYITSHGNPITPLIYEQKGKWSQGLILNKKAGKYGYISLTGEERIPFIYSEAHPFHSSQTALVTDEKGNSFFINTTGQCVRNCP